MTSTNKNDQLNSDLYDPAPTIFEEKTRRAHELNFYKSLPYDFQELFIKCKAFTMLSRERLYDFYTSINYIVDAKIPGDIVEIGCWAGGSISMARMALNQRKDDSIARTVLGYDTFTGHSKPSDDEYDVWGKNQAERFDELRGEPWAMQSEETVTANILNILGNHEGIKLIKGKIEETARRHKPHKISILRIDVDWYEPTYESLEQFYGILETGGILIVDDYGHHSGSKKAVDEFFKNKPVKFFHTDYSCISSIKI